jgi:hypothetical protein
MEAWERLFDRALTCLDTIAKAPVPMPRWTFGGGTALTLQLHHRQSHDIDIFLEGPEWLSILSPRVNDTVEGMCRDYQEGARFLKLSLEDGEIDFIASPLLTKPGAKTQDIHSRPVLVETPAEIITKKIFYRAAYLRVRDIVDIAVVCSLQPKAFWDARSVWGQRAADAREAIRRLRAIYREDVSRLSLLPVGETIRDDALDIVDHMLARAVMQSRLRTPTRSIDRSDPADR